MKTPGIRCVSRRSAMRMLAAAGLLGWSRTASARTPVTLIVPFAAGGPTDIVARLVGEGLSRQLSRPFVIENVGGAGGAIGTLRAARARPDGATMVLGQMATHALTPIVNPQAGYDPVADFEPIGLIATAPMVLVARPGLGGNGLAGFAAHVRAQADRLSFAHAGLGATSQVACELFNVQLNVMPASVAYRGTAPALQDIAASQVDFGCDQITSVAPLVRSGAVQAVALMAAARSPVLPDLPTAAEQGFPDLVVEVWNGVLYPKGVDAAAVIEANAALRLVMADPAFGARLAELGAAAPEPGRNTPVAFRDLIVAENDRWRRVLARVR